MRATLLIPLVLAPLLASVHGDCGGEGIQQPQAHPELEPRGDAFVSAQTGGGNGDITQNYQEQNINAQPQGSLIDASPCQCEEKEVEQWRSKSEALEKDNARLKEIEKTNPGQNEKEVEQWRSKSEGLEKENARLKAAKNKNPGQCEKDIEQWRSKSEGLEKDNARLKETEQKNPGQCEKEVEQWRSKFEECEKEKGDWTNTA